MEPTATPPPVEKGHVKRRRGAARPLGDVTNILPDTPANPTTRRPRPLPSDADASACSATVTPVSKPSCSAGGATISAQSATVAEGPSLVKSPISTVYTRRKPNTTHKRRSKRNHPANDKTPFPDETASCPPHVKATRTNRYHPMNILTHAASKKSTRMENTSSGKPELPEDFVKKQRAYFEEIDAFELPEEEASETDLE
ncbi:hypothetical protein E2562_033536 [Oryza meyeriana var. granulata]|uniref:Sororin C-terminal region domain-containing protein n=1 Tax=Oryza meyeriana var. granulata TaxID=110450 RepID=A0A6G1CZQ2_9ORYZ|nr:hypothetical protein E2562_004362 [Oryza meyeriana var. granulata]KAF0927457.1 hypothetical protein E2562_033536 [Oryza meyeriana var. granulata]